MTTDRPKGLFSRLLRTIQPAAPGRGLDGKQAVIRRLAAILAADMAGYSRLMGVDEEGTLASLRSLRRELINPKIAAHRGNIIKTTGDGLLVEFPSVVDAMRCAVDVQRAMPGRGGDAAPDRRIEFRIGVNLGDIIFEDGDIYGDGVNVAARLEQLAQPGGICVSNIVYTECAGKIDGAFEDGGACELKNIAQPVHVWHWQPDSGEAASSFASPAAKVMGDKKATEDRAAPQTIDGFKGKPSIAVLPFVNMSEDKSQEYFADGMTEDIITGLSCDSRLFVTARNSTFVYKGQPVDIRTVGKELGVRYVLEGSIRPMGERLRITMQLIDTASGNHVWADKIDRPMSEIFATSDEVVDGLVMALCANLGVTEANRTQRQRPEDLQAWALCVQAEVLLLTQTDTKSTQEAERLARWAAEIEPGYALSWALLGWVTSIRIGFGLNADLAKSSAEALSLAGKALRLAPNDPTVLCYCGAAATWAGQAVQGIDYLERSLTINPNSSSARVFYGIALLYYGRLEAGAAELELFLRRSPKDPFLGFAYLHLSYCYLVLGDFQQAEQSARNGVKHSPGNAWGHLFLAISLTALGRDAEAKPQIQQVHQLELTLTRQNVEDVWNHVLNNPEQAANIIALIRGVWSD